MPPERAVCSKIQCLSLSLPIEEILPDLSSHTNGSVLFLAHNFPPENNIASARPYRFYKHLPRLGYGVQVITGSSQDEKLLLENVVRASTDVRSSRRKVMRLLVRCMLRPFVAERNLRWGLASYQTGEQLLSQGKICAIFSTSPPIVSNIVAGRLKARYGIPWIADFRDPIVGNPGRENSGIRGLRDMEVERWSFRHADALIANTDAALEMWKRKYPQYADKMHVIWNGFDRDDTISPMPLPLRGYRLLVHAGGMHIARHAEILLCSLQRLIQQGRLRPKTFRLRLVGPVQDGWARDPKLVAELVRLGCLEYDGNLIPKEDAKQAMATADSLILFDWLRRDGAVQVPAKLFDYIRIGRPVLAVTTRSSPAERLLSRSGIRYTSVYPEDPAEETDRKILHFLTLPVEPVVAHEWFWKEFEATGQTQRLAALLDSHCSIPGTSRDMRRPRTSVACHGKAHHARP